MDSSMEERTTSPLSESLLKHYVPLTTERDTSSFSSPSSLASPAPQAPAPSIDLTRPTFQASASAPSIDLTRPTFRAARVVHGRRPGASLDPPKPRGFETPSENSRPRKFESYSEVKPRKFESDSEFKSRKFESDSDVKSKKFESDREQSRKSETSSEVKRRKFESDSEFKPRKFESSPVYKPRKSHSHAMSGGTMSTLSLKRGHSGGSPGEEASGIVYSMAKIRRFRRDPQTSDTPKQQRKSMTKGRRRSSDPPPPGFKKVYKMKRLPCPFRIPGRCREDYVKEYLKFHVWDTHFDVRFFRCDQCSKPFIQDLDVRNHMKSHH